MVRNLRAAAIAVASTGVLAASVCQAQAVPPALYQTSAGDRGVIEATGARSASATFVFLSGLDQDRQQWSEVASLLSKSRPDWRFIRLDLIGQGESRVAKRARSAVPFEVQIEVLERLLDDSALAGAPVYLVGHSYGAGIALAYAMKHPTKAAHLILVAPYVDHLETYQPGIGPWMSVMKESADFFGMGYLYEHNVMMGTSVGTALTWPYQKFLQNSRASASQIMALTEGIRPFRMTQAVARAEGPAITLIRARYDELIAEQAHRSLWAAIPHPRQGNYIEIKGYHDLVRSQPVALSETILKMFKDAPTKP